jgi:hypothetical protein
VTKKGKTGTPLLPDNQSAVSPQIRSLSKHTSLLPEINPHGNQSDNQIGIN